MASAAENSNCSLCTRLGLKPFTKNNILFYYAPLHALSSYGALSVNILSPQLASRLIPKRDVTNFLLIHTLFGTTLYIYSRPHLKSLDVKQKITYSVLGSTLFSLGSVLVWAIIRSSIPHNAVLGTALGLASGYGLARVSYEYLKHVDAIAEKAASA
ncbi:uncharacterized protein LOC129576185 [Sitodiplosis mosellana]|uniref:uncharacterized protein LOC129576185 n=1 Tax=Sitodiplosis mosellana TaxID=263140 RepID=UPI0024447B43|nr:uncharacterized protein LOC129576185 [Sitodiplosis mosellana]